MSFRRTLTIATVDRSLHHAMSAWPAETDEQQVAALEAYGDRGRLVLRCGHAEMGVHLRAALI
jgi:hypothetical protein